MRLLQYEVVERRPRSMFQSAELARGNAVHSTIARNLRHWIDKHRYIRPRAIGAIASDAFDAEEFTVDWKREELTMGKAKDHTIAMALAHSRHVANDISPTDVELPVEAYVPEVGEIIRGVIDVVSTAAFEAFATGPGFDDAAPAATRRQIRDTKTSSDSPGNAPAETDADQLVTYDLICRAMGDRPSSLIVDYLWPRDDGKARSLSVDDDADRTPRLVEDYRDLVRTYSTGLFPRTGRGSWLCRPGKCDHHSYCILGAGRLDL